MEIPGDELPFNDVPIDQIERNRLFKATKKIDSKEKAAFETGAYFIIKDLKNFSADDQVKIIDRIVRTRLRHVMGAIHNVVYFQILDPIRNNEDPQSQRELEERIESLPTLPLPKLSGIPVQTVTIKAGEIPTYGSAYLASMYQRLPDPRKPLRKIPDITDEVRKMMPKCQFLEKGEQVWTTSIGKPRGPLIFRGPDNSEHVELQMPERSPKIRFTVPKETPLELWIAEVSQY